jgi:hypothetical protein
MKNAYSSSKLLLILFVIAGLPASVAAQAPHGATVPNPAGIPLTPLQAPVPSSQDPASYAFRNTVDKVPAQPTTPVFKLIHNYPRTAPPADCKPDCKWLSISTRAMFAPKFPPPTDPNRWQNEKWERYLQSILDYIKQGQDPNLDNRLGFQPVINGKTRWFNVPWMAYDASAGREYVHGTTNERTAHLNDLVNGDDEPTRGVNLLAGESEDCKKQWKHGFETWAVGYYNDYGGYAIGRAFPPDGRPRVANWMGLPMADGLPFQPGTVVVKFLTTNAPPTCVPYLKGSPEWQINRHKTDPRTGEYLCDREVQISRIVQVDVAVVDLNSPTRWVYATYGFDGSLPGNFWDRLVPVGVQWGSDPWSFPAVPKPGLDVQQSVLNPNIKIFQHYGCEKRLAGPVDNPQSSCVSCHASAYAVPNMPSVMGVNVPPSFGFDGMCVAYSLENATYFQNQQAPQGFPGGQYAGAVSLDTSLQLEVAFDQYGVYATQHKPNACKNPGH